jgi:hypothetical protein
MHARPFVATGAGLIEARQRRGSSSANGVRQVCYRFCYLNEAGNIANCEDRECAGDLAALVYARGLAQYRTIEIWDGRYRVAHIAKGEDPLRIGDRTADWHWSFPA